MNSKNVKPVLKKKTGAKYVDGFLIAVPVKNLPAYKRMSQLAGKVWKEYGAIDYKECTGDDLNIKMGNPFPSVLKLKKNETAVFSWITYKSKKHRDSVNAKVMKDPRIAKSMDMKKMPFEMNRMSYGGFKVIVDLGT